MNHTILDKTVSFIEANNMITGGDKIVVGVSGGADSVCLLFLLCALREKYDTELYAVHVHHGIREEADDDAQYVRGLCERLGVSFELVREDVPARATEWKMSEEEAGRRVRYEAFADACERNGCSSIAVAHNLNDMAETVLFHMFRGSGLHGLTGMAPVRSHGRYKVIRPILCLERDEIETVLNENDYTWVTDRTNLENKYARNRIRHNILPEAEIVAPGAVRHICEAAEKLSETEELLEELELKCLEECVIRTGALKLNGEESDACDLKDTEHLNRQNESCEDGRVVLDSGKLMQYHPVIRKRAVLSCLKKVTGGGKDIGALQVEQIIELAQKGGNRQIDLARGVKAERSYGMIVIYKPDGCPREVIGGLAAEVTIEYLKPEDFECAMPDLIDKLNDNDESNKYTKLLDYDKMDECLTIRNRQPGDYMMLMGADGEYHRKSLKKYMIDAKIPSHERDSLVVAASGSHCVWLVGYRISDCCRITEGTKNIVRLIAKCPAKD